MGLEAATYIEDFVVANPTGSDGKSQGDDHIRLVKTVLKNTLPGLIGRAWRSQTKSGTYTVVAADNMTLFNCTSALTLDLTAAATLGNGHMFYVHANGANVTIDPNGAELINGAATLVVPSGSLGIVTCDGTGFKHFAVFAATDAVSPAQITGNQNDYNPTGLATTSVLRINSDARRNVTGLATGVAKRELIVHNVGTFPIVFKREDGASTAANRLAFGCVLGGGQTMELVYDGVSSRWRSKILPDPIGSIRDFAGGTIPDDFLACDGTAVSRTTYAALFNEIGTAHGEGDGATTFNVPDSRGRAALGVGTGTIAESCAAANVNTTNETWDVVSNVDKWITGMKVQVSTTSGLPAPLAVLTDYWIIRASATTIQFASTLANAQNGTAINLTTQGTGTHTVTHALSARTLGDKGGEEQHAQSSTELPSHTHTQNAHGHTVNRGNNPGSGGSTAYLNPVGDYNSVTAINIGGTIDSLVATNQNTGGNVAANTTPPYIAFNRIIRAF